MTEKPRFERRRAVRRRRRIPCDLWLNGKRHRGFVVDLSERGLYVQTRAAPRPHDPLRVSLRDEAGEALELEARVARRYVVPERLASVVRGGIGLEVLDAPEAYRALAAARATERGARGAHPAEAPPVHRFRVRLRKRGSARSRTLEVDAETPEAAEGAAHRKLGAEWEVVSATQAPARREGVAR